MTIKAEIRSKVIEMAQQNKGRNQIAHELGIGQGTVSNILKESRESQTSGSNKSERVEDKITQSIGNITYRKYEQSLQPASSCNEVIVQPDASISIGVGLKETSPHSLKPQDAHGVGLAFIPINPNSSTKPKPRNGSPLSHILIEDFIEHKTPPNPLKTKTRNLEVNINNEKKYLNNQDETIKEEKQYQHRASLSDFKNTSRRSEDNPGKEDQDQEEEPIDLGIDWNRRFPRYESRSSLRNYKTRDKV
jgi:predicted transcriptional regulator